MQPRFIRVTGMRGRRAGVALALLWLAGAGPARAAGSPAYDAAFWKYWGDGRAELSGYEFTTSRYGQLRRGVAVAIVVTETFSNSARVKSDPGKHPASDEFPVVKLNLVEDFQTGIYDYNLMTSAFVALAPVNGRPAGSPTKVSFSSQEWCGNVYGQALFDENQARLTSHSYFDGEGDQARTLSAPPEAGSEDALFLWAHGLAGPVLADREKRSLPMLRSLRTARLLHQPEVLERVTLERVAAPHRVEVPAGVFTVESWMARIENGAAWTYEVEVAAPHRVIAWHNSEGEKATLLGTDRLAYWKLNGLTGQAALAKLGLKPRAPRMN